MSCKELFLFCFVASCYAEEIKYFCITRNGLSNASFKNALPCFVEENPEPSTTQGQPAPLPRNVKINIFPLGDNFAFNITWEQTALALYNDTNWYKINLQTCGKIGSKKYKIYYNKTASPPQHVSKVYFIFHLLEYGYVDYGEKYCISILADPPNSVHQTVKVELEANIIDYHDTYYDNKIYYLEPTSTDEKIRGENNQSKSSIWIAFLLSSCILFDLLLLYLSYKVNRKKLQHLTCGLCPGSKEDPVSKNILLLVENPLNLSNSHKNSANHFGSFLKKNEKNGEIFFNLWNANQDILSWASEKLENCSDVVLILSENAATDYNNYLIDPDVAISDFTKIIAGLKKTRIQGKIKKVTIMRYENNNSKKYSGLQKDLKSELFCLENKNNSACRHILGLKKHCSLLPIYDIPNGTLMIYQTEL